MSLRLTTCALLLFAGTALADDGPHAACQGTTSAQVTAARALLKASPQSLSALLKLADALVEANCYDEAVHTLEDGEAQHPRNNELQAKLRTARSFVSEQVYFAGKEDAEQAAKVSRNLLRCTRLGDLAACDEALKLKPDDVEMLLAKGAALQKAARLPEAEQVYRRAKQLAPDNAAASSQLAAAQTEHQNALGRCQKGAGDDALKACQSVLLPGAADEFAIQTRLGALYQQRNQPAPALAAYIAANSLKPGDRGVAAGIVALTDTSPRTDAVALAARGSALITLQRGREALESLRQAQALAPTMPDLRTLMAQAQKLAGAEGAAPRPASAVVAANAPPPTAPARVYSNAAEPTRSY